MLELTDLGYKRDALVDGLSRGMKQRLSIARVLVHDPKVLLLDEPAGNLDPRARIEMRELLKELRRMGKTILISSHILPGAGGPVQHGRHHRAGRAALHRPGGRHRQRAKTGTVLHVGVADNQEQARAPCSARTPTSRTSPRTTATSRSRSRPASKTTASSRRAGAGGFRLTLLKEEEVNLETAFMRLTKGMVQ